MRVIINTSGEQIPVELRGLISSIKRKQGDCEQWLKGYNKNPYNFTWYGYSMIVEPLYASYGVIGYSIYYRTYEVHVDNEMRTIEIID